MSSPIRRGFRRGRERVWVRAILVLLCVPCSVLFAQTVDTTALLHNNFELRRLEAEARLAETEVDQTSFWYRLLPRVSVTAHVGQRSILFVDPTHPWSIPSDAMSAAFTFDIDKIVNSIPHKQALTRAKMTKIQLEKRKSEIIQELSVTKAQLVIIDSLIVVLGMKRDYKQKLVELNELRYESNKSGFEDLAKARLDLADTEIEVLTQVQRREDLRAKLSALGVQP
jgi:outer membrane protein TolC